jgi:hypothetical protein
MLEWGSDGDARISAAGRATSSALGLPLGLPVRVQVQASNGECWEETYYPARVMRNDGRRFSGRAGSPSGAFID